MAKKMILVNEDIYKTLLNKQNQATKGDLTKVDLDNEDSINLNFIRKNMKKARDRRGKNASAKNVAYNQELRRYLCLRKEIKDKPLKVELSNLAKLLLKKKENSSDNIPKRFRRLSKVTDKDSIIAAMLNDEGDYESFDFDEESYKQGDLQKYLSPENNPFYKFFDPDISTEEAKKRRQSKIKTPMEKKEIIQEQSNKSTPSKIVYPPEIKNMHEAEKIYDYIMEDPDKFGFNAYGNVIKGGKPILHSRLAPIIEYLLEESKPGFVQPPGYKLISKDLKNDPYIYKLIQAYKKNKKSKRRQSSTFKPQQWKQ